MNVWMHDQEIEMIESVLDKDKTMLEWGSGGSTLYFSPKVRRYYSIEHDYEWHKKLCNQLKDLRRKNADYDELYLGFCPINEDFKSHPSKALKFKNYIKFADQILPKDEVLDIVLVDGRARPECAKQVLNKLHEDSIVFIHDYFAKERPHYREVEKYYEITGGIKNTPQTLVMLKPFRDALRKKEMH